MKKECEGSLSYYLFLGVLSSRGIYRTSSYFFIHSLGAYITRYIYHKFVYFFTPTGRFQRIHKINNDNNINNNNSYSNYYSILFFLRLKIGVWFLRAMVDYVVDAVEREGARTILL